MHVRVPVPAVHALEVAVCMRWGVVAYLVNPDGRAAALPPSVQAGSKTTFSNIGSITCAQHSMCVFEGHNACPGTEQA